MVYSQSNKTNRITSYFNDYKIGVETFIWSSFMHLYTWNATRKIIGWFSSFNDEYLTKLEGLMDRNTWKISGTPIIKVHSWWIKKGHLYLGHPYLLRTIMFNILIATFLLKTYSGNRNNRQWQELKNIGYYSQDTIYTNKYCCGGQQMMCRRQYSLVNIVLGGKMNYIKITIDYTYWKVF